MNNIINSGEMIRPKAFVSNSAGLSGRPAVVAAIHLRRLHCRARAEPSTSFLQGRSRGLGNPPILGVNDGVLLPLAAQLISERLTELREDAV